MGLSLYYFAGPRDNQALSEFARSLGLRIFAILAEKPEIMPSDDPSVGPFCYLCPVPREELHPYGSPPGIGPATDPLIDFWRSYFHRPDALVIGRLYCSDDVPDLFRITKPYFSKLAKWVRGKWEKLPEGQFIGPEGQSLLEKGVKLAYFPPGVKVEARVVRVEGEGRE